jgi:CRP/FNR family transcriptional regulator, cyclic AMP receptor protein
VKTMVPLGILGIISNILFIAYGYLAAAYPPLVLHLLLLPLNLVRLREMLRVTKQVEQAASGDHNMSWVKPFTSTRPSTQRVNCSLPRAQRLSGGTA